MTEPFGVKQKAFSWNICNLVYSKKCSGFSFLSIISTKSFNQSYSFQVRELNFSEDLYFQCEAIPLSAKSCIGWVLIWISIGLLFGPIIEVCKDWYLFIFGDEI